MAKQNETGHVINVDNFYELMQFPISYGTQYAPPMAALQIPQLNVKYTASQNIILPGALLQSVSSYFEHLQCDPSNPVTASFLPVTSKKSFPPNQPLQPSHHFILLFQHALIKSNFLVVEFD